MTEVLARVSISKTQLYRLLNAGEFPKPVPMGCHRVAFVMSEVNAWIKQRIKLRDEGVGAEMRRARAVRAVEGRR
jgi:prophage regulatory protein